MTQPPNDPDQSINGDVSDEDTAVDEVAPCSEGNNGTAEDPEQVLVDDSSPSLRSIVESILFAAERPVTINQLKALTGEPKDRLEDAVKTLLEDYEPRGIQLADVSGGFQFRTNPQNASWVKRFLAGKPVRLTRPMLETLAIIAYRQPVTRPEVEDIRGVDCGGPLRSLLERELIRVLGKKEEPGRPILYGTTKQFLELFQINQLRDLPTLREFTELTEEHKKQVAFSFDAEGPNKVTGATASNIADSTGGEQHREDDRNHLGAVVSSEDGSAPFSHTSDDTEDDELLISLDDAIKAVDNSIDQMETSRQDKNQRESKNGTNCTGSSSTDTSDARSARPSEESSESHAP